MGGQTTGPPPRPPSHSSPTSYGSPSSHARARRGSGQRSLSFSALYERVDAANTPQFADHLRQLEGQFVRRHDDAYALTGPGEQVVRAVLVGTYDSRGTWVRQFESTNEV